MKKAAILIMSLTLFTKITGFLRDIILSYTFGATNISDAYIISLTIPNVLFALIGTGIATTFIPLYNTIKQKNSLRLAKEFTNNLVNCVLIICTIIIVISHLFLTPIVKLFASGFDEETLNMAVCLTGIGIFSIYFSALVFIFKGYLNAENKFVGTAIIGVPLNLFTILAIIIAFTTNNVMILAIGSIVAVASQLLVLIPNLSKSNFKYKFILDLKSEYLNKLLMLSLPVILGVSVNELNILVDRTIASQISVGGISAITYASRLNLFIQGIFVLSITTVMYSNLSKMSLKGDLISLKRSLSISINGVNLFIIPVTIGAIIFATPIVEFLFGRGAFDHEAVTMTSQALFYYSFGMIAFGIREIFSRVFYALHDTKTPMINAVYALVLNVILNIILSKYLGIGGLALGTSISAFFCTILLFNKLRIKLGGFDVRGVLITFFKVFVASIIMGGGAKLIYFVLGNYFNLNNHLTLILAILLGIVFYCTIIYFMKVDDVDIVLRTIKRKILQKKNI